MIKISKYRKCFQIPHYDCDKNKRIRPLAILSYLGETSGEHSDKIGFEYEGLNKSGFAWMLNKWKVKIKEYPRAGDKIVVETWTSQIDRFYARREFLIYNSKARELTRASSLWIFIDMKKKRPVRIPKEFLDLANLVDERPFTDFYEFERNYDLNNYQDFSIRRTDIDYNNHVNNSIYLSWILEVLPERVYEGYLLEEFEIFYKKEAVYGNRILSSAGELDTFPLKREFIHQIVDGEGKENHALAWTKWIKNKS